jgi:hypothetical protein
MRRIIIFVTLTLTSVVYASGQPAPAGSAVQKGRGRVMVKRLPDKVEGVMLKDGQVKLKPGYKFVKRTNGTVAVARISGSVSQGNNISGTWSCSCTTTSGPAGKGKCAVTISSSFISCESDICTGSCTLLTTVEGARTNVIMY